MGITEHLIAYSTDLIATGGYPVVGVLMVLESMVFPVPSEAVLPFAGFLVTTGTFHFWQVLVVSTLASLVGSLISYAMGAYGGRPFLTRWGRYFLVQEHHLEMTVRFFEHYGERAIFFSRFVPVVRHLISIPAGIGKMPLWIFSLYTFVGAGMWNAFLIYVGIVLGDNWHTLASYTHYLDIVVVVGLVGVFLYFTVAQARKRCSPKKVE